MGIHSPDPHEQSEGYSEDFKARVKAAFPDWQQLHQALDSGSEFVGRYLDDSRYFTMKPEDIVKAFESGNQNEVLETAKRSSQIGKLYSEWCESRKK